MPRFEESDNGIDCRTVGRGQLDSGRSREPSASATLDDGRNDAVREIMATMMLMTARKDVMPESRIPEITQGIGWLATAVMAAATVAMMVRLLTC